MTSPYERPDRAALADLRPLVDALSQELTTWRERALKAEARAEELQARPLASAASAAPGPPGQGDATDAETSELRRRLDRAREQVDMLRTRLRFLEERTEGAA